MIRTSAIVILLLSLHLGYGQQITNTDCIGAIPICQDSYSEAIVPVNEGMFRNEINGDISCMQAEIKVIWYSFTVNNSGKFGFIIEPNVADVDYDWSLFNLTNNDCSDIFNSPELVVSCNAAGNIGCEGPTGATGATTFNIQGGDCGAPIPNISETGGQTPFNDLIDVEAGNTYVLAVSNWDEEPGGYTIDFSLSQDIGIFDQVPPTLSRLDAPIGCVVDEISLEFSENIKCETISTDNVAIEGIAPGTYELSSEICRQGGVSDNEFRIELFEPQSISGEYNVTFTPTNALPIYDQCDNGPEDLLIRSFEVINDGTQPSVLDVEPDSDCQINSLTILFDQPMLCSGITENSFTVQGPQGFILGETQIDNCETQTSFTFLLDEPIIDNEEYILFINQVPGFNLTNECLQRLGGSLNLPFQKDVLTGATAEEPLFNPSCEITELVIPFTEPILCNTVRDNNISIEYQGNLINGTIVGSNCNNDSPSTLTELNLQLDETISEDGLYNIVINTNGIDEFVTNCGTPSESSMLPFNVTLEVERPELTNVRFGENCNISSLILEFSKDIDPLSAGSGNLDFTYNDRRIPVTGSGTTVAANAFEFDIAEVLNEDGEYTFDLEEREGLFIDECGTPARTAFFEDDLNFMDCDSCFIYVPTAFSPNDDFVNDEIGPLSNCELNAVSFWVFDRWGNLVFESIGEDIFWNGLFDGKEIEEGVYAYIMEVQLDEFRMSTSRTLKGSFQVF